MAHRESEIKVGQPTAMLVQARLGEQVDEVRRCDPLVRQRLPGGVHQMRSALRRLRDGLATARPFLAAQEVTAVRAELKYPDSHADALHECRKAAKRLRYAVEPLVPVVGKPAMRTVKDAQRLQKALGEHHDAVVARVTVQRLLGDASSTEATALRAAWVTSRVEMVTVGQQFGIPL